MAKRTNAQPASRNQGKRGAYSYNCRDYAGMSACPGAFVAQTEEELWRHIELHAAAAHNEGPVAWSTHDRRRIRRLISSFQCDDPVHSSHRRPGSFLNPGTPGNGRGGIRERMGSGMSDALGKGSRTCAGMPSRPRASTVQRKTRGSWVQIPPGPLPAGLCCPLCLKISWPDRIGRVSTGPRVLYVPCVEAEP